MITENELRAAIAECQGERTPNANTCIKLAAYYTILDNLYPGYSNQAPLVDNQKSLVDYQSNYQSETEFGRSMKDKDTSAIFGLVDELLTVLQAIQPPLYNGFMRKLNEL